MVPAPDLVRSAAAAREITQFEADLYLSLAMFSVPDAIPFEYLVPIAEAGAAQWDHSATTRLIERWDELDSGSQEELLDAVDGLADLIEGDAQGCIPITSVDAVICVGESISHDQALDLPLGDAAAIVRPWVREAMEDSWPMFESLFGAEPQVVEVFLSDLTATGGYTFGAETGVCHLYVDVLALEATDDGLVHAGDSNIPDGVPLRAQVHAAVAHQLFHCFQRVALADFDTALWEGTAVWAEHHIYPTSNTELPWMETWISDPDTAFSDRLYDASFVFLYADLMGDGEGAVAEVLEGNAIARLDAGFEEFWHEISVAAWNQGPVGALVDDGGAALTATVGDLDSAPIAPEIQGEMKFSLPLYSRDTQAFEFLSPADMEAADLTRLWLDLSRVPSDVKVSAIAETAEGWLDPVLLTGAEWEFCWAAIGACSDVEPTTVHTFARIVLIATNVDNGVETFSIPWHTFNPHLTGTWVRVQGPISTVGTSPFWVIGTELGFDETARLMTETTSDWSLANAETGWECTLAGEYSIGADPEYGAPELGNVSGTITVVGPSAGETFTNDCLLGGVAASGVHTPIAEGGETVGFEIRDYDTLWVYAFERFYVYERIS